MTDLNSLVAQISLELADPTPEVLEKYRQRVSELPPETKKALEVIARGALVRELPVGFEGARHYYFCKYGWELPSHVVEWVRMIITAYETESGALIEGFRGSTKSTVSITTCEYLLGKNPTRSGLIVAATETDANSIGKFMADTIEMNAGWKVCFPSIVPDKDRGWGAEGGYFIRDTGVPSEQWVQITMKDHQRDPSFLAASVTSGSVGKHPTLFLMIDDMHTGKNTSSKAELKTVKARFFSDVFPTINRAKPRPFFLSTFTPWDEDDTNADLKKTGVFSYSRTPILRFDPNGDAEFEGEKCFLTWSSVFDLVKIKELRRMNTSTEFARMYLCDLQRAQEKVLTYITYPHEKIDPRWVHGGGVDYASVIVPTRQTIGGRSHFALAVGAKTPMNTIVVVGGVVEQCTMAKGGEHVLNTQDRYINWRRTAIEKNGGGKEFIQFVRLNPNIRAQERDVAGLGSKQNRLFNLFDKVMPNGILMVSDADTPFLNTFRHFLDRFPNVDPHDAGWDIADSVFHMTAVFPECLQQPSIVRDQPVESYFKKRTTANPWASLGR
jgi:hypothetical protein